MGVDLRSTSAFEVGRLELELRRSIKQASEEEGNRCSKSHNPLPVAGLDPEIVAIGNRPGRELLPNSRILQIARAVDAHLANPPHAQRASNDANIPISLARAA